MVIFGSESLILKKSPYALKKNNPFMGFVFYKQKEKSVQLGPDKFNLFSWVGGKGSLSGSTVW